MGQNKKVIYTCIVGDYDELSQPLVVDSSFDFVCFSNDIKTDQVGVWKIRPIPFVCKDHARQSRYVKILPHQVLKEYEWSLWIDANLQILEKEFYEVINQRISSGKAIFQVNHCLPECDCIYEEMKNAFLCKKSGFFETFVQYIHLKSRKFPRHWGLFENNIILRRHHDAIVMTISDMWWSEYMKYSKRDQFSLMYVYWANDYYPSLLFGEKECTRNVSFLQWRFHHLDFKADTSNRYVSRVNAYLNALRPKVARLFDLL